VRIPLDYYRILGLPIQATAEQLQQAYRDRTLQLPRREYSEAAIAARKQLLEKAYAVLSAPKQRTRYDASYFAYNYDSEAQNPAESPAEARSQLVYAAVDSQSPSIEIPDELFVGALLILQELGEYELVVKLGSSYLSKSSVTVDSGQKSNPKQVLSDIILTVALACLELGREQWQQGQYENAATSLETGQKLLLSEELFPSVRSEIQADLAKLRPYCILELLARPEEIIAERRQGLKLLQDMLQQRGGIDGTSDDGSGLTIDDFLRFIQQLRSYLTAAEQQRLFEAESQRPSAVATYLAVYALIARGFAQRQPALIRQAKLLLIHLSKRQDLYLEQALCFLLLGQTAEASRALELSHENEPLAFIREHSQGSPDLLPGLCLYAEGWLQTEVFPHFRDLAQHQASLKDYFADNRVQAYLEALPMQVETTNERAVVASQSLTYAQATRQFDASSTGVAPTGGTLATRSLLNGRQPREEVSRHFAQQGGSGSPALVSQSSTSVGEQHVLDTARGVQNSVAAPSRAPVPPAVVADATSSQTATQALNTNPVGVAIVPAAERVVQATANQNSTAAPNTSALAQVRRSPQRSRRRKRSRVARVLGLFEIDAKKTRLVMLAIAGVLGTVVLGFLVSQTYAWLRQTLFPAPSLQTEQPLVQLNQPPLPIPNPGSELLIAEELLTQETAEQVIQSWLSTKAAAFSSNHSVDKLEQILVEPVLSQWQRRVQKDKADNRYRQYKHNLKVDSVQTNKATPDNAQVETTVHEVAQVYENGRKNQNSSYDQNLRVRYDLVRQDGQWRIREMTVLN
jgi:hypothetical protein